MSIGSWEVRHLSGVLPSVPIIVEYLIGTSSFVGPSYTIVSKAITGTAKSAGVGFGSFGAIQTKKSIAINSGAFVVGGVGLPKFAWPPNDSPFQGRQTTIGPAGYLHFVGPVYTIVSKALTGSAKTIGFVFGYGSGNIDQRTERLPGALGAFHIYGQTGVLWILSSPVVKFQIDGHTDVLWFPVLPAFTWKSDGHTDVVWNASTTWASFKSDGHTDVVWNVFAIVRFESDGHTEVIWYVELGQKANCFTGGGDITALGPQEKNYVF